MGYAAPRWIVGASRMADAICAMVVTPVVLFAVVSGSIGLAVFLIFLIVSICSVASRFRSREATKATTRYAITNHRAIVLRLDAPQSPRWVMLASDVPIDLRRDALRFGFEMPRRSSDDRALMEATDGPVPSLMFEGLADPASALRVARTAQAAP